MFMLVERGGRTKVIALMRSENNQEPIFEATDDYVKEK
jgi:hypothetical protein